ncbi:MAG: thioredoxin family protein [Prevotellaceae bacterium]|nr:thioredoxin family protein [Prevotellaceae bacterium]
MKGKRFLLAILAAVCAMTACAQMADPVKVTYELRKVSDTEAQIVFNAAIENGWHMYSTQVVEDGPNPCEFTAEKLTGCTLDGTLRAVGNVKKMYEEMFAADVYFFENRGQFVQKLKLTGGKFSVEGYLTYSACNDVNCIPPTTVEVHVSGEAKVQTATPNPADDAATPAETIAADGNQLEETAEFAETDSTNIADTTLTANTTEADNALWTPVIAELKQLEQGGAATIAESSLWRIFLLGLLGGLVALLTPCVWPIIPMTVSFFLKRSGTKRQGVRDAWFYGMSIIVIYVTLGLLVTTLFGANALNSLATNAVFNIFFFLMLIAFAASFFGAFELTLPSSWSNAVDSKAERTGGLLGIFLMAFTLTLVSFSCTGPIIGFLLVEVATDGGSMLAPTVGMFGFAVALALPFTLFALFPNWLKQMPKSGGWMNTVKVVLGFVELAFALKFLSVADLAYGWHILDRETFLAIWIVLFALLGLYLLGKIKFPHDDDDNHIGVVRFFLALISLAFSVYMLPGLWGAPLKAVSAFTPPMNTQDFNLAPEIVVEPMFTDYDEGMAYAKQQGKPVMLDFTGFGCVNCRKMEAAVWTDSRVAERMRNDYVLIQLFVDDKTALPTPVVLENENGEVQKLRSVGDKWSYLQSHKFGASTQPFYVLIDNNGYPLTRSRSYDEDIDEYLRFLDDGLTAYQLKQE